MFQSIRASQLALRIGLGVVFLWLGVHKFVDPQYWVSAWLPQFAQDAAQRISIASRDLINLIGIFEVLAAASLVTGFFMRWFAGAAALFLAAVMVTHAPGETLARDIGLIGGLVALALWPERNYA